MNLALVQSLSHVQLRNPMDCSTPGFPVLHHLPELAQTHVHWVSNAIQPCHPLTSSSLPVFSFRVFSSELAFLIMWLKYWNFSFSISPSNEYSGFISFRIGWFDLLVVQGTLKSLLQHHSSTASFCSAQASLWSNSHVHDYWKNHSLDYMDLCQQTDVSAF